MRGERGGIGILLNVLLVILVTFVAYQAWFKEHKQSAPAAQDPTAITEQVRTAVEHSMTTVTERLEQAMTEPAAPVPAEEIQPPPIIPVQPGPSERPAMELAQRPAPPAPAPARTQPIREVRRSDAFAEASRRVPMLLVSQMAPNNLGMYSANPGGLFLEDIVVSHDPTGKGESGTDGPYGQSVLVSLHNAVQAASYAVGYDVDFFGCG